NISFLGDKKIDKTSINIISYNNNNNIIEKNIDKISDCKKLLNNDYVTWINIYGLHDVEKMKEISDFFSINNLFMEDILNTGHIPKYVEYENYKGFVLKIVNYNHQKINIEAEQISIIVFENIVLSFQEKSTKIFDPLRKRIRKSIGRIRNKKVDYLMFAVIDILTDNYLQTISKIGQQIENTAKIIFDNSKPNIEQHIFMLKTEIGFLRMQVRPVKELILRAIISEQSFIKKENTEFFNDILELLTQANETIELYNVLIADQLNSYNSFIGNKMNKTMKILTVFASIFIPLTFIAGVYGMNFENIPELRLKYGYFMFWGLIIIIGGTLLLYFKKRKWFE
ncbi:MAG: magnesium/cobalt transporter CorA, partial [Bacteroidales bacterium]|nr:magnesium/cobalt transporter CorA [Bacteroidales bacterium]